ncbi:MAG: hypothetical protein JSV44_06775, partial [Candidatus Zixiibacteriota bacterium]
AMSGAPNSGKIGHPALPACGARILLPQGSDLTKIEINAGKKIPIGTGYFVEPVERPFILSSLSDAFDRLDFDSTVYSMRKVTPESKFEKIGIQYFRGYQILILKLSPVGYIPASGTLFYHPEMSVRIEIKPSGKSLPAQRGLPADRSQVAAWIDNPTELSTYASAEKIGRESYDMLILTPSAFADAFQPLKQYHDSTGILTEIHTLDQIGGTDPHLVRQYIKQEYLNNGIQYVLIGGDDDLIPALDIFVVSWEGDGAIAEYNMPADFYFSCLDGTFNYDNDGLWGEPTDGEGGGDIDLFPEVHIGRYSASSPQEVSRLVEKTLAYLASESPYLQKILLAGEQLGFGGMGEYGGYAMDEMVDYSGAHGFTTYGFPANEYNIEKLYDVLSQPWNYWSGSEMIAGINAGIHIIDHLGHSNTGYAMRTDTSMIKQQLGNTEYCFVYAEGCNAGQFDFTDCWAEYMTTKLTHGAFGCIANSRVGLGSRSTAHPVHVFNREFWDAIYNANEAGPQLGRAITDARADHAYHIDDPGIRWTFYEINLFGDPAVAIKSVRAVAISYPDGIPENIRPYRETSFNVLATGIGTGSPIPGSGQLHYTIDSGEPVTVNMAEVSPNLYEATLPSLECGSTIEFHVSVEEGAGERFYAPDPATPLQLSPISDSVVLFEDDFETDKGWTISGGLWQRGIPSGQGGSEQAYPVPDPTEGCNGPQVFGYNLNGDYENNLPETYITSPAIDCTGRNNIFLRFCRWLGVEQPIYDKARILVSNDSTNWTEIWANYAAIADLDWVNAEYDISNVAADRKTVYLRWVMGPTDQGLVYIGWNIDDVQVVSYNCNAILCGDATGDGDVNLLDILHLIDYLYGNPTGPAPEPIEAGDANADGDVNLLDILYLIDYLYDDPPGPDPLCP